jgi:hypothetical protein
MPGITDRGPGDSPAGRSAGPALARRCSPNLLQGVPLLEKAMRASGFELDQAPGRRQPDRWFQPAMVSGLCVNIPVDLLIADRFAGTANSRRTASLEPHDKMAVRKVSGLELATVDFAVIR